MKTRTEILSWILLISIFLSTWFTHMQLHKINSVLISNSSNIPKIKIIDMSQFEQLSNQFVKQWNAEGQAIYLLQPKSNMKTHKEKAICTIPFREEFPIRSELSNELYETLSEQKYMIFDSSTIHNSLQKVEIYSTKSLVLIPIYHNKTIIAEMYIQYSTENLPEHSQLLNYVLEAQILSQLLY